MVCKAEIWPVSYWLQAGGTKAACLLAAQSLSSDSMCVYNEQAPHCWFTFNFDFVFLTYRHSCEWPCFGNLLPACTHGWPLASCLKPVYVLLCGVQQATSECNSRTCFYTAERIAILQAYQGICVQLYNEHQKKTKVCGS